MYGVAHGHHSVVCFLLQNFKADVHATSHTGETPLMCAAMRGHLKITETLVAFKSPINARDRENRTALMLAAEAGHFDVVKVLVEDGGASVGFCDRSGCTAWSMAKEQKHEEIAAYLARTMAQRTERRIARRDRRRKNSCRIVPAPTVADFRDRLREAKEDLEETSKVVAELRQRLRAAERAQRKKEATCKFLQARLSESKEAKQPAFEPRVRHTPITGSSNTIGYVFMFFVHQAHLTRDTHSSPKRQ